MQLKFSHLLTFPARPARWGPKRRPLLRAATNKKPLVKKAFKQNYFSFQKVLARNTLDYVTAFPFPKENFKFLFYEQISKIQSLYARRIRHIKGPTERDFDIVQRSHKKGPSNLKQITPGHSTVHLKLVAHF